MLFILLNVFLWLLNNLNRLIYMSRSSFLNIRLYPFFIIMENAESSQGFLTAHAQTAPSFCQHLMTSFRVNIIKTIHQIYSHNFLFIAKSIAWNSAVTICC
jgi:hypothetical protein